MCQGYSTLSQPQASKATLTTVTGTAKLCAKLCWDSIERDQLQCHTVDKISRWLRQLPKSNLQSVHFHSQPNFVYRAVGFIKLHLSNVPLPRVGRAVVAEGPENSTSAGTQDYRWLGAGKNRRLNGQFLANVHAYSVTTCMDCRRQQIVSRCLRFLEP